MAVNNGNFGEGSIPKLLVKLSLPIVAAEIKSFNDVSTMYPISVQVSGAYSVFYFHSDRVTMFNI